MRPARVEEGYGRVAVETVSKDVPLNFTTFTVRGVVVVVVVVPEVVDERIASVRIEIVSDCPMSTSKRVAGNAIPVNAATDAGNVTCGFNATSLLLVVVVLPVVVVDDAIA